MMTKLSWKFTKLKKKRHKIHNISWHCSYLYENRRIDMKLVAIVISKNQITRIYVWAANCRIYCIRSSNENLTNNSNSHERNWKSTHSNQNRFRRFTMIECQTTTKFLIIQFRVPCAFRNAMHHSSTWIVAGLCSHRLLVHHELMLNLVGDLPPGPTLLAFPSKMESNIRARVKTPPMVAMSRINKCVKGTWFWVISMANG